MFDLDLCPLPLSIDESGGEEQFFLVVKHGAKKHLRPADITSIDQHPKGFPFGCLRFDCLLSMLGFVSP